MQLEIQALTNAVNSIKPIVEMSTQNGLGNLLFHFNNNNTLSLRYSDGKNSIELKLPVEYGEDDVQTDIVVNYKQLLDALALCTSGTLKVNECQIVFDTEKKTIKIKCVKSKEYINGDDVILKPTSKFEQELGWNLPETSMRYQLLTRMDYTQLFNGDGEEWDKNDLKNILTKLAIEKSKPVSISSQNNMAFISTYKFASVIPLDNITTSLIFSYKSAKALITVLSRIDNDKICITKTEDEKFISITDNETIGIQFEMSSVSKIDWSTICNYLSKEYDTYQLKFDREALSDAINALAQTDKMDKHTLKFQENEDGDVQMVLQSNSNKYNVLVSGRISNKEELLQLEIPLSIKIIKDMINLCDEDYISMFMKVEEDKSILLRIGDIDMSKTTSNEDISHKIINYTIC